MGKEYINKMAESWAKELDRAFLNPRPIAKIKPLTRWQHIKRFLTKKRSAGLWLTYKLMEHYGIQDYDCDY